VKPGGVPDRPPGAELENGQPVGLKNSTAVDGPDTNPGAASVGKLSITDGTGTADGALGSKIVTSGGIFSEGICWQLEGEVVKAQTSAIASAVITRAVQLCDNWLCRIDGIRRLLG
jgi:hypothetical protein